MKKSRLLVTLTLALLVLCFSLCFVACGGTTTTLGGESAGGVEDKYEIEGALDIHVSVDVTDISVYTNKVTATNGEDTVAVAADVSKVNFGTAGIYELTYSYDDVVETVSVYIYNAPTITLADGARTTYAYSEYYLGVTDGITAKDSFNNDLDVRIFDNKGAENSDGSLEVGSYTFTFAAVDMAGQIVYVDKDVTITAETSPVLADSYTYDVEEETYAIELSEADYDTYLSISLAGVTIPGIYAEKVDGKIILNGDYLYSVVKPGSTVNMRLLTSYGYDNATFTLTDVGEVAYNDEELELFCSKTYECFEDLGLPAVEITNPRQTERISYELYKDGELCSEGRTVNFKKDGAYTLKVTIRGKVIEYKMNSFYNLGFATGRAYKDSEGLVAEIKEGYTLVSYKVENVARETLLTYDAASDTDGSKFEEFNTEFKKLSKKPSYILTATVSHPDYGVISQQCDFTIIPEGYTVIGSEKEHLDNGSVYAYFPDRTPLTLEYGNIGGRTSAYRWEALANHSAQSTMVSFAKSNASVLKKGMYLTFDIYCSSGITLTWFANNQSFYLYNQVSQSSYDGMFTFFDANGEKITSGSIWGGSFNKKWITIQIKLHVDFEFGNSWRGLSTCTNTMFGKSIYLANFKVSDKSREYIDHTCDADAFDQKVTTSKYLATEANCDTYATYYYSCICGESAQNVASIADADKTFVYEAGGYKHTYDQEVATEEYLASEKTCSKLATYYYSCVCGEKGSETFEYGELGTVHAFDQKIDTEEYLTGETDPETGKSLYYTSCLCGLSSEGTDDEATFAFQQVPPKENSTVILATKADLDNGNVTPRLKDKVSLDWVENGAGRDGVFQWHSDIANLAANETYLWVANGFKSSLTSGKYVSVDIYFDANILLYIPLPEVIIYNKTIEEMETKCLVKIYDENGNRISSGSWSSLQNKWITIEFRLQENYQSTSWRGLLGLYNTSNVGLNDATIYLDNIVVYSNSRG